MTGERVADSMPPAMTTWAMPERMVAAASCTAIMPVAHWRWTVPPGVSGGRPRRVGHVTGGTAAALEHLAENDVVDVAGLDLGCGDRSGHRLGADVLQAQPGQAASGAADGRAQGGDDDGIGGVGHGVLLKARTSREVENGPCSSPGLTPGGVSAMLQRT